MRIPFKNINLLIQTKVTSLNVIGFVPGTAIETIVHVCESNTAYVSCPLGQAIGVVDAFYGRDERSR